MAENNTSNIPSSNASHPAQPAGGTTHPNPPSQLPPSSPPVATATTQVPPAEPLTHQLGKLVDRVGDTIQQVGDSLKETGEAVTDGLKQDQAEPDKKKKKKSEDPSADQQTTEGDPNAAPGEEQKVADGSQQVSAGAGDASAAEGAGVASDAAAGGVGSAGSLALAGLGVGGLAAALAGGGAAAAAAIGGAAFGGIGIGGGIFAGPVVNGHGLQVAAYKPDGTRLATGTVNSDGSYTLNITENYSGAAVLEVTDSNADPDYIDEATGQPTDLAATLRALIYVSGAGNHEVNITPVTELVLRELGGDFGSLTQEQVDAANQAIAEALGLQGDLLNAAVTTTVDADGNPVDTSSAYGKLLAAISGMEELGGLTTEEVLAMLADAISGSTISGTGSSNLQQGAAQAGTELAGELTVDGAATAAPTEVKLTDVSNTGLLTDNLTSDNTPTLRVSFNTTATDGTAALAGDVVKLYNGATLLTSATLTSVDITNGYVEVTLPQMAEGSHNLTAKIADISGNISAESSALALNVDTTAPTLEISDSANASSTKDAVTYTFRFSEAVTGFDAADITVTGGAKGTFAGSGTTYTLVVTPTAGTQDGTLNVSIAANAAQDVAGNQSIAATAAAQPYDTLAPAISSVEVPANGQYGAGKKLTFKVNFSEAVTAGTDGNAPKLLLTIGNRRGVEVSIKAGSDTTDTTQLTFEYTVTNSDASNGTLALTGFTGTVADALGTSGTPALGNVASLAAVVVDGATQGAATDGYLAGVTIFADANGDGVLDAGDTVAITDETGGFKLYGGSGPLVMYGGTDISTGLDFNVQYEAPEGYTVINPISSLVRAVQVAGTRSDNTDDLATDAAYEVVRKAIFGDTGGPNASDAKTYDPFQIAASGDATAIDAAVAYQRAAAAIATYVDILSEAMVAVAVKADPNTTLTQREASVQVFNELAGAIGNNYTPGNLWTDLQDASFLGDRVASLINDISDTNKGKVVELLDAAMTTIAAAEGDNALQILHEITKVQQVAQGDAAADLADFLDGGATGNDYSFDEGKFGDDVTNANPGTIIPVAFAITADGANANIYEGQTGETRTLNFTVTRSGNIDVAAGVDYQVGGDERLTAADFAEGAIPLGTLYFAPGETEKTLEIRLAGNDLRQGDRPFAVSLVDPTGAARIDNPYAFSAIRDDDPFTPVVSLNASNDIATGAATAVSASVDYFDPTAELTVTIAAQNATASATTIQGNLAAINTALANLTLNGSVGQTAGALDITVAVDGRQGMAHADLTLHNAPTQTVSQAITVTAGEPQALTGLSVADVDGGYLTVTLGATNGTLALGAVSNVAVLPQATGLQLVGLASDINAALQTLTFTGTPGQTTGSISVTTSDGDVLSGNASGSFNVTINADAPEISVPDTAAAVKAGVASAVPGLVVADSDSSSLTLTLTATSGTLSAFAVGQAKVTSGNSGATLTIEGSPADLNATLDKLRFTAKPDATAPSLKAILSDGDDSTADPTDFNIPLALVSNTPPAAGGNLTASAITEDTAATLTLTGIKLSDADGTAPTQVRILSVAGGTLIDASNNPITLGANGTKLDAIGGNLTLKVNPDTDRTDAIQIQYVVVDPLVGTLNSAPSTISVPITAVNDAPVLAPVSANLTYAENATGLKVAPTLTIDDVDSPTMTGAVVRLTNAQAGDVLVAGSLPPGISASFANGALTITGAASRADYETLLRQVTYRSTSDNPDTTARSVQISVNDGAATTTVNRTINVIAVNDAPVIANLPAATLTYVENAITGLKVAPTLTLTDADSANLTKVIVAITDGYSAGQDVLAVGGNLPSGVTASFNPSNGYLTFSGSATLADYQAALRAVTYANTSDAPAEHARTISLIATDGTTQSSVARMTLTVTPTADKPVVDLNGLALDGTGNAITYVKALYPSGIAIAPKADIKDVDNTQVHQLTVTLTNGQQGDKLALSASADAIYRSAGLTLTQTDGQLVFTGDRPITSYTNILRGLLFTNTGSSDSGPERTITVVATDATDNTLLSETATVRVTQSASPFASVANGTLTLAGNPGDDQVTVDLASGRITTDLGKVAVAGDPLYSAQNVNASAATGVAVKIIGNLGNNSLTGSAGDDTLIGGGGVDTLSGGAGNDRIFYQAGSTHDGGVGSDTLVVTGDLDLSTASGTVINFEVIDASSANAAVTLKGGDNAETLIGGRGADTLVGGAGDTHEGGLGRDIFDISGAGNTTATAISIKDLAIGDVIRFGDSSPVSVAIQTVGSTNYLVFDGKYVNLGTSLPSGLDNWVVGTGTLTIAKTPTQTLEIKAMSKDNGTGGDFLTNDGSAGRVVSGTLSADLEAGQVVQVSFDGTNWGTAQTSGTQWQAIDNSLHTGNWTIQAKVVHLDTGAANAPVSQSVTLDTSVNAFSFALTQDTGSVKTDGVTSEGKIHVSGLETGSVWQYSVDGGSKWNAGGGEDFDLFPGQYAAGQVQVKQTDKAGNTATVTAGPIGVDVAAVKPTLALAADTGIAGDGVSRIGLINVSGLEAGATWQYSIDGGANWINGSGGSFTLEPGRYGSGSIQARQTDLAGNSSAVGRIAGAVTVEPDLVAPTLRLTEDTGVSGDGVSRNGSVTIGNLAEGATWRYSTDGGMNWTSGNGASFTLTEGVYGTGSVQVEQTSAAGSVSLGRNAIPFGIDTRVVAPGLTLITDTGSNASDGITSRGQINVVGLESGATWQYSADGGATWNAGSGSSFTLPEGAYAVGAVQVRQTDVAGNVSSVRSNTGALQIDTGVATPSLALSQDTGSSFTDGITSNPRINVTGLEAGATWKYSTDAGNGWRDGTGSSFELTTAGKYDAGVVQVRQTDAAGNISQTGRSGAPITLDTGIHAPTLTLASDTGSSASDGVTSDVRVNVSGLESGATWQYSTDGGANWHTGSGSSFELSAGSSYIAGSVLVRQTDQAGNLSSNGRNGKDLIIDQVGPEVASRSPQDDGQSAPADNLVLTFSEAVSAVAGKNIRIVDDSSNGSTLTISAIDRTQVSISGDKVTINPKANLIPDHCYHVEIDAGAFRDAAGNEAAPISDATAWNFSVSTLAISVAAVTADNVVNKTEAGGSITVGGVISSNTRDTLVAIQTQHLTSSKLTANGQSDLPITDIQLGSVTGSTGKYSLTWSGKVAGSSLSDGVSYTAVAVVDTNANDAAIDASASRDFRVDTSVASPSIILASDSGALGDGIANNGQINVIGIEAGASWQYSRDGGTTWMGGIGTGFMLAEGDYAPGTLQVRQTDVAGNTSPIGSNGAAIRIDATAPAAPVITGISPDSGITGDGITNSGTGTLSGTAEAGSILNISVNGQPALTTTADAQGYWIVGYTGLPDGSYTAVATATDSAGNRSAASPSATMVVDSGKPGAPVIATVAGDDRISAAEKATGIILTGAAETGSQVQVTWGETTKTVTANNGTWTANFATGEIPADGSATVSATATDLAGNTSEVTVRLVDIDTQAPAVPTITGIDPDTGISTTDGVTNVSSGTLRGTAEAGSTVSISVDGQPAFATTTDAQGHWSLSYTDLTDGSHTAVVRATDVAGNVSAPSQAATLVVDTQAPEVPVISRVAGDDRINAAEKAAGVTLTGTAEAGSQVHLTWGNASKTVTASAEGNWIAAFASGEIPADGNSTVSVTATDLAGNSSTAATRSVNIDTAIPATPALTLANDSGTAGDGITHNGQINVTGIETGATWQYSRDGGITWLNGVGNGFALAEGSYAPETLQVRQTDAAGNPSAIGSNGAAIHIDTSAPSAPIITGITPDSGIAGDGITHSGTGTLSGTAEADSRVSISVTGQSVLTTTAGAQGNWGVDYTGLTDGSYTAVVTVIDAAGNISAPSQSATLVVDSQAPSVVISSDLASLKAGETATIRFAFSEVPVGFDATDITTSGGILTGLTPSTSDPKIFTATFTPTPGQDGGSAVISIAANSYADTAGNSDDKGAFLTLGFDTLAPAAPVITGINPDSGIAGDGITHSGTSTLSGTAEAGSTLNISVNGQPTFTATADVNGHWSVSYSGLTDGSYTAVATATDAAGNTSQPSSAETMVVDSQAPGVPTIGMVAIDDKVNAAEQAAGITLTGTAEAGSQVQVNWGNTSKTITATLEGNWSAGFASNEIPADGNSTVNVVATDLAGNSSQAVTRAVGIDTQAPTATLAIIGADDNVPAEVITNIEAGKTTNDNTPVLKGNLVGSLNPGEAIVLYDGATRLGTANVNGSDWSLATSGLGNGAHSFTARVEDVAGNWGASSSSYDFNVDASVPNVTATITGASDDVDRLTGNISHGGLTNDAAPELSGSLSAALSQGESVILYDGDARLGAALVTDNSWRYTPSQLTEGLHSFTAVVENAGGNQGVRSQGYSLTVDAQAPAAPGTTLQADTGIAGDDVTSNGQINVSAEQGASWEYSLDGGKTWTTGEGSSFTLSEGAYSANRVQIRQIDAAGNVSPVESNTDGSVIIDQTAPATPEINLVAGDDRINATEKGFGVTLTGTAEAGSQVQVTWGNTNKVVTASAEGNWSVGFASNEIPADGNSTINVIATDLAGNTSSIGTRTVQIDTQSPTVPAITGITPDTGVSTTDGITHSGTGTLSGTAEAGSTVNISVNGQTFTATADAQGHWSADYANLTDGSYTAVATATDAAGNTSQASVPATLVVDSLSPATVVNITGADDDMGSLRGNVANGGVTDDSRPVLNGSLDSALNTGETLRIYQDGVYAGDAIVNGTQWTFAPTLNANGPLVDDSLDAPNTALWQESNWSNGGVFLNSWNPSQVDFAGGKMILSLNEVNGALVSGEYQSLQTYGHGLYQASLQASGVAGTVTGFFTYNGAPHDEIDVEILGDDPTQLQVNYWTNGVQHATTLNLGFDASQGIHTYAFRWEPNAITWYVDGVVVHTEDGSQGVLPTHPGKLMTNLWGATGTNGWSRDYNFTTDGPAAVVVDQIGFTPLAGPHSFTARVVDAAGNEGPVSTTFVLTVDTTGPGVPTVSPADMDPVMDSGRIVLNNSQINVSGLEAGATWQYTLDGGKTWLTGSGSSFTLADGRYGAEVQVRQVDQAGNPGTPDINDGDVVVDTVQPVFTGSTGLNIAENTTTVGTLTASDANGVTYSLAASADKGLFSIDATTGALRFNSAPDYEGPVSAGGDNDYQVNVQATDIAGNVSVQQLTVSVTDVVESQTAGKVIDGYLSGATVYLDQDYDGIRDAGEVWTTTDLTGGFNLNTDGRNGILVATGGTDTSTGLANQAVFTAVAGSTTINPLTTLVSMLAGENPTSQDIVNAEAKLKKVLALTSLTDDFGRYDPLAATLDNTASTGERMEALVVQAKAIVLQNLITVGSAALSGATGTEVTLSQTGQAIYEALYQRVTADSREGEMEDDLLDASKIREILEGAAARLGNDGISFDNTLSGLTQAASKAIAATSEMIKAAVEEGSSTDALTRLTQVIRAQKVAQGEVVAKLLAGEDASAYDSLEEIAEHARTVTGVKLAEGHDASEDAEGPQVTAVTFPANGTYHPGDNLTFRIGLSEGVLISGGLPALELEIGGKKVVADLDPTQSTPGNLVFGYTVQNTDTNGQVKLGDLKPGTGMVVKDLAGNTLEELELELGDWETQEGSIQVAGGVVDTTAPEILGAVLTGNGLGIAFSENIEDADFAGIQLLRNGQPGSNMSVSETAINGSQVIVTTNTNLGAGDFVLATLTDPARQFVTDASGNKTNLFVTGDAGIAIGGAGDTVIDLSGRSGNYDLIDLDGGNDTLTGNSDVNELIGAAGNDRLNSGAGNDELHGGTGADTLDGGVGADFFGFKQGDSTAVSYTDTGNDGLGLGDTFGFANGLADLVRGFGDQGDTLSLWGTQDSPLAQMVGSSDGQPFDQRYFLARGDFTNGLFTLSDTGTNTLVVYDGDASAGVSRHGILLEGVIPTQLKIEGSNIRFTYQTLVGTEGDDVYPYDGTAQANLNLQTLGGEDQIDWSPGSNRIDGGEGYDVLNLALNTVSPTLVVPEAADGQLRSLEIRADAVTYFIEESEPGVFRLTDSANPANETELVNLEAIYLNGAIPVNLLLNQWQPQDDITQWDGTPWHDTLRLDLGNELTGHTLVLNSNHQVIDKTNNDQVLFDMTKSGDQEIILSSNGAVTDILTSVETLQLMASGTNLLTLDLQKIV